MKKMMLGICILCFSIVAFGVIPLKDVSPSHWAYESVQYLIEKFYERRTGLFGSLFDSTILRRNVQSLSIAGRTLRER